MGTRPRLSSVVVTAGVVAGAAGAAAGAAETLVAVGSATIDAPATRTATTRAPRRADRMLGSVALRHPPLPRSDRVVRSRQHRRPRSTVTDLLSPSSTSIERDGAPPPSRVRVV